MFLFINTVLPYFLMNFRADVLIFESFFIIILFRYNFYLLYVLSYCILLSDMLLSIIQLSEFLKGHKISPAIKQAIIFLFDKALLIFYR